MRAWNNFISLFRRIRKNRKALSSPSVCMFVGPRGTSRLPLDGFWWNLVCVPFLRKCIEKIQFLLEYDKNNGYFTEDVFTFMTVSRSILLIMRNILDKIVEKILCSVFCNFFFFRKSCRLWDNAEKYYGVKNVTNENMIWRISVACWISNATRAHTRAHSREPTHARTLPRTHTEISSLWQQWFRERACVLRYVYIACFVGFCDILEGCTA